MCHLTLFFGHRCYIDMKRYLSNFLEISSFFKSRKHILRGSKAMINCLLEVYQGYKNYRIDYTLDCLLKHDTVQVS